MRVSCINRLFWSTQFNQLNLCMEFTVKTEYWMKWNECGTADKMTKPQTIYWKLCFKLFNWILNAIHSRSDIMSVCVCVFSFILNVRVWVKMFCCAAHILNDLSLCWSRVFHRKNEAATRKSDNDSDLLLYRIFA